MANSPEILNPHSRLVEYGIAVCKNLGQVDVIEGGIAFDLFPQDRLEFFGKTPFLRRNQLSASLRPRGFNGSLGQIIVELGKDPKLSLKDFKPRLSVPEDVVEVSVTAEALSTGRGVMGGIQTTAWYYGYPNGSFRDPLNFPLRRVIKAAEWMEGSCYEEVLAHLGTICTTNSGASRHSYNPGRKID